MLGWLWDFVIVPPFAWLIDHAAAGSWAVFVAEVVALVAVLVVVAVVSDGKRADR